MKNIITYGTFDLMHQGHINILKRARAMGDRLIVGVTSENYDFGRGKLNVSQSLMERVENIRKTGLADEIIIEEYFGQKVHDIKKYNIDTFVIGSDWKGKFDYLKPFCNVVYLERTKGISSTELRNKKNKIVNLGVVGNGRIAKRFIKEAKYVSGIDIEFLFGRNPEHLQEICNTYSLKGANSSEISKGNFLSYVKRCKKVFGANEKVVKVLNTHYGKIKKRLKRIK